MNYYTRSVTRFDPHAWPLRAAPVPQPRATYTETGWEVFAPGLTDILAWVKQRYGNPSIYVTENGAAFFDPPALDDDRAPDPLRVDYLRKHLKALHAALAAGVDVRGYFVWSLLDNFEWTQGFAKRFGLVHVNYATLRRTPKASFAWYRETIAQAHATSARAAAARIRGASAYTDAPAANRPRSSARPPRSRRAAG